METIQFNKNGGIYEATINVAGDFNLHFECPKPTRFLIQLRTGGTKFADVQLFGGMSSVFDCDFTGFVYPKDIRIISYGKVDLGYVTQNA